MASKFFCDMFHSFRTFPLFIAFFLITELDAVLHQSEHGVATSGSHALDTGDTSGDESDASQPRRRVNLKRAYKMKKVLGLDDVNWFFVTGATDAVGKPSHFYCRIYCKYVSVLTHGSYEVLRHF